MYSPSDCRSTPMPENLEAALLERIEFARGSNSLNEALLEANDPSTSVRSLVVRWLASRRALARSVGLQDKGLDGMGPSVSSREEALHILATARREELEVLGKLRVRDGCLLSTREILDLFQGHQAEINLLNLIGGR